MDPGKVQFLDIPTENELSKADSFIDCPAHDEKSHSPVGNRSPDSSDDDLSHGYQDEGPIFTDWSEKPERQYLERRDSEPSLKQRNEARIREEDRVLMDISNSDREKLTYALELLQLYRHKAFQAEVEAQARAKCMQKMERDIATLSKVVEDQNLQMCRAVNSKSGKLRDEEARQTTINSTDTILPSRSNTLDSEFTIKSLSQPTLENLHSSEATRNKNEKTEEIPGAVERNGDHVLKEDVITSAKPGPGRESARTGKTPSPIRYKSLAGPGNEGFSQAEQKSDKPDAKSPKILMQMNVMRRKIKSRDETIKVLEAKLETMKQVHSQLRNQLLERDAKIGAMQSKIRVLEETNSSKNKQVAALGEELSAMRTSCEDVDNKIKRQGQSIKVVRSRLKGRSGESMEILDLPALLPSDPPAVDSQIKKSQSTASSKKAEKKVVSKQLKQFSGIVNDTLKITSDKGIGLRTPNRRLKQADAKPQPKRSSWWW